MSRNLAVFAVLIAAVSADSAWALAGDPQVVIFGGFLCKDQDSNGIEERATGI